MIVHLSNMENERTPVSYFHASVIPKPFWVTSLWNSTTVSGVQQPRILRTVQYKYHITDLIIAIKRMSKCIYSVIIIILI